MSRILTNFCNNCILSSYITPFVSYISVNTLHEKDKDVNVFLPFLIALSNLVHCSLTSVTLFSCNVTCTFNGARNRTVRCKFFVHFYIDKNSREVRVERQFPPPPPWNPQHDSLSKLNSIVKIKSIEELDASNNDACDSSSQSTVMRGQMLCFFFLSFFHDHLFCLLVIV